MSDKIPSSPPPQDPQPDHSKTSEVSKDSEGSPSSLSSSLNTQISPEVETFVESLPLNSPSLEATKSFKKTFNSLGPHILLKAQQLGFPSSSIEVDFHKVVPSFLSDPKIKRDTDTKMYMQYFVDQSAQYLVEVETNCKMHQQEFGTLTKISFTDGDPHNGKRPCFVTFKTNSSSYFKISKTTKFVYKPRSLCIEHSFVNTKHSLFTKINSKAKLFGFCANPFNPRQVILGQEYGLHAFVEGIAYNQKIEGGSMPKSTFVERLIKLGFENTAPFERWLFMEEAIKKAGLGNDAHMANFIYNPKGLYPEPIDLEVYDPKSAGTSLMPSLRAVIRNQLGGKFPKEIEVRVDTRRAEIKKFLDEECQTGFDQFATEITTLASMSPTIRYVPMPAGVFMGSMAIAADKDDFREYVLNDLNTYLTKDGFKFLPSLELSEAIDQWYIIREMPIFHKSPDMSSVSVWGIEIAEIASDGGGDA